MLSALHLRLWISPLWWVIAKDGTSNLHQLRPRFLPVIKFNWSLLPETLNRFQTDHFRWSTIIRTSVFMSYATYVLQVRQWNILLWCHKSIVSSYDDTPLVWTSFSCWFIYSLWNNKKCHLGSVMRIWTSCLWHFEALKPMPAYFARGMHDMTTQV